MADEHHIPASFCPRRTTCGRCGNPKPDDGNDWCRPCENENAVEALAALRGNVVRIDHGGWISGGSASDQVRPADLEPGDRIVHGDRAVIVERTRPAGSAWIIAWHAGTASGVFDVDRRERITRLVKDTDTA